MTGDGRADEPSSFDITIAHPARVYDYLLGGKDNYEADRTTAQEAIAAAPNILTGVRANRAFLRRAVTYLVGEAGIRQFLDIGTGLPTAENTHEVAQSIAPESRIVYVDNDPIVLAHARALLDSTPEGATAYIDADARDAGTILRKAARTLDFSQPVAVMLLLVLQYVPDSDDPRAIVSRLMDAMPPGSYLTISDTTRDIDADRVTGAASRLNAGMGPNRLTLRTREEIAAFFDGLDLVDPGLVPLPQWRAVADSPDPIPAYAGIGRKPDVTGLPPELARARLGEAMARPRS
jgi:hypothetical protein